MTGTHQLNGLFHFLFAQVYRCKNPRGFLDYDFFQQFLSQGIFFQGVREHQQKTDAQQILAINGVKGGGRGGLSKSVKKRKICDKNTFFRYC